MYVSSKLADRLFEQNGNLYSSFDSIEKKQVDNSAYTTYLTEHYAELADYVCRLPHVDPNNVGDLMNDVWISLRQREMRGEGFDEEFIGKNGDTMEIDVAIKNTLLGFSKKELYRMRYNDKVFKNNVEATVLSISDAVCGCGEDENELAISVYNEASAKYSSDTEELAMQDMIHDDTVREALAYAMIATEDREVSIETILNNVDYMLTPFKNHRCTLENIDSDGLCLGVHKAMFKDYEKLYDGSIGKDIQLETAFRTVFRELLDNRDNLMAIFSSLKAELHG